MKRIIIAATIVWSVMLSQGYASTAIDTEMYQVFNSYFGTAYTANGDLSPYSFDGAIAQGGDVLRVDAVYSYSPFLNVYPFGQGLGYTENGTYHELVAPKSITTGVYQPLDNVTLTIANETEYELAENIYFMGSPFQRWVSDPLLNPLGNESHFEAFSITDQEMLAAFNKLYGTYYVSGTDQVWMIAIEAANLGTNPDYTDLVAVVSRPASLNTVPVPGAVWLLGSGVLGLLGLRKRHGIKG